MNALLVLLFALLFPLSHIFSGWAFSFAEISTHISLIYLPAFMRLANVLILGCAKGTVATLLGGVLLMRYFNEPLGLALLNTLCSAAGPLLALCLFQWQCRRPVELTSLKDLAWLTLIYAISNAVLHHAMWSVVDPAKLEAPQQVLWMVLGDVFGALLGAYIMKWLIVWYRQQKIKVDLLD